MNHSTEYIKMQNQGAQNSGHPNNIEESCSFPNSTLQTSNKTQIFLRASPTSWEKKVHGDDVDVLLHFMRPQLQTNFQQQIFPQVEAMVACVSQRSRRNGWSRGKQEKTATND